MIVNHIIQWLVHGTHREGPSAILAAVPLLTIPVNGNGQEGGAGSPLLSLQRAVSLLA